MTDTRKHVVLVDDSPDEAAFVRRALAISHPEAELTVIHSGHEALARLTRQEADSGDAAPADVVLLDLKIPALDGHAILAALRSRFSLGELPVVVFTSSREPSDVSRAYAAGANSYAVKPLVFEEYLQLVQAAAHYWLDVNVRQA
jgi:CheY-like chemotaxis protein